MLCPMKTKKKQKMVQSNGTTYDSKCHLSVLQAGVVVYAKRADVLLLRVQRSAVLETTDHTPLTV